MKNQKGDGLERVQVGLPPRTKKLLRMSAALKGQSLSAYLADLIDREAETTGVVAMLEKAEAAGVAKDE